MAVRREAGPWLLPTSGFILNIKGLHVPTSSYPQSHASGCLLLAMGTSTAVTPRRGVLGKRLARVLNVGLGLMEWSGQSPRSSERGEERQSPGQPTPQACRYLPALPRARHTGSGRLSQLSGAGLRLPSPRADFTLHCRAAAGRLPSPTARRRPALQPGASNPPGRSKGPSSPNVPPQQRPVAKNPHIEHPLPYQHPKKWVALDEQGRKSQARKSHTVLREVQIDSHVPALNQWL